jgi:hypothetical protein
MLDQSELTIGLDGEIEKDELVNVKNSLTQDQVKEDFLLNSPEMPIGFIPKNSLLPETDSTPGVLKNSSCQIKFELRKLNKFPNLNFEDMSQDETVKLLNGK